MTLHTIIPFVFGSPIMLETEDFYTTTVSRSGVSVADVPNVGSHRQTRLPRGEVRVNTVIHRAIRD